MKKVLCMVVMVFLFLSCTQSKPSVSTSPETPISPESISIEENIQDNIPENAAFDDLGDIQNIDEVFWNIPKEFKEDKNFLQCSAQSMDQCVLSSQSPEQPLSLEVCDSLLLESNKEGCKLSLITSQAVEKGNVSMCEQLELSDSCKYEVYVSLGTAEKKPELCDLLSSEFKSQCNNTIVQNLVYETLDESWCDKFIPDTVIPVPEWWEDEMLKILKDDCLTNIQSTKLLNAEFEATQEEDNISVWGAEWDEILDSDDLWIEEEVAIPESPENTEDITIDNVWDIDQIDADENSL